MLWVAGVGQRLPRLDVGAVRDPTAAPDQRACFVVAAPAVTLPRAHQVETLAAEQAAEHRVAVPTGEAPPRHLAVRSDQDAAAAVGNERVLTQDSRRRKLHS